MTTCSLSPTVLAEVRRCFVADHRDCDTPYAIVNLDEREFHEFLHGALDDIIPEWDEVFSKPELPSLVDALQMHPDETHWRAINDLFELSDDWPMGWVPTAIIGTRWPLTNDTAGLAPITMATAGEVLHSQLGDTMPPGVVNTGAPTVTVRQFSACVLFLANLAQSGDYVLSRAYEIICDTFEENIDADNEDAEDADNEDAEEADNNEG